MRRESGGWRDAMLSPSLEKSSLNFARWRHPMLRRTESVFDKCAVELLEKPFLSAWSSPSAEQVLLCARDTTRVYHDNVSSSAPDIVNVRWYWCWTHQLPKGSDTRKASDSFLIELPANISVVSNNPQRDTVEDKFYFFAQSEGFRVHVRQLEQVEASIFMKSFNPFREDIFLKHMVVQSSRCLI